MFAGIGKISGFDGLKIVGLHDNEICAATLEGNPTTAVRQAEGNQGAAYFNQEMEVEIASTVVELRGKDMGTIEICKQKNTRPQTASWAGYIKAKLRTMLVERKNELAAFQFHIQALKLLGCICFPFLQFLYLFVLFGFEQ